VPRVEKCCDCSAPDHAGATCQDSPHARHTPITTG
jgi:hypothetical protein